ncbi:MAG: sulfur carrier protein ThiS [Acidobacteriota bacterium]|nr:sulfur carrier protein ThiS [Acidobacteriota bacterium]MDH3529416.1 sulfur carrier protein ThiS [Acidobacteriota bacterium]
MISLTINGEVRDVPAGKLLSDLIEELDLPDTRIAIEVNGSVIRRNAWCDVTLSDSDVLEIIHFVGGG